MLVLGYEWECIVTKLFVQLYGHDRGFAMDIQGGFETHDAFALHGTAVHHRGARPRDLRDISRGEQYLSRIARKSLI